jgi:hypothetical protein
MNEMCLSSLLTACQKPICRRLFLLKQGVPTFDRGLIDRGFYFIEFGGYTFYSFNVEQSVIKLLVAR